MKNVNDKEVRVVLLVSRSKDNKNVPNFVERRSTFISDYNNDDLIPYFEEFVDNGQDGELSRMYCSVNTRDMNKVHTALIHYLIDHPDTNLCSIKSIVASIAAKQENAATKRWMYDFDVNDQNLAEEFCSELKSIDATINSTIYKTPHAFAIICEHGFDERKLDSKWKQYDISLKKDDMLCIAWKETTSI